MRCPSCGLENMKTAEHCDCGYSFSRSSTPDLSGADPVRRRVSGGFYALSGAIVFLGLIASAIGVLLLIAGESGGLAGAEWWLIGAGLSTFWLGWLGLMVSDLADAVAKLSIRR